MPELPEVETIRRQLAPALEGRTLERIEVLDPRWCSPIAPEALSDALEGRGLLALRRRGKYLIWELEDEVHLLLHLRMTGTLLLDAASAPPHTRVLMRFAGSRDAGPGPPQASVAFVDPRRFGTGQLALGTRELVGFLDERLGVEPLDPEFGAEHLRDLARGRRAPIKAFLLDQRRIAGVGNIYADEALFRARIHPLRPAGRLTLQQWRALAPAIVEALEAGIDAQGASIDDFRHTDGVKGSFQDRFLVHRRQGEPCPECGEPVTKLVAAGRGTYVCRRCQPAPRTRRVARV